MFCRKRVNMADQSQCGEEFQADKAGIGDTELF